MAEENEKLNVSETEIDDKIEDLDEGDPKEDKGHEAMEITSKRNNDVDKHANSKFVKKIKSENISLNKQYLERDLLNSLSYSWKNHKELLDDVTLYNEPFQLCILQNFINAYIIKDIVNELTDINWIKKQMDLYEFHQTIDLITIDKPFLKKFYNFMLKSVLPWMKEMTGINLTHISASCSMYNIGDYLLVHDDLIADRKIAFVFYMSPWQETWTDNMGGALEIFNTDDKVCGPIFPVNKIIPPKNNQFVFFKVGEKSFHQVGEVTNYNYPRLTINGWFHGPQDTIENKMPISIKNEICNLYKSPNFEDINLSEWINSYFLKSDNAKEVQQHFEDNSEASLEDFLTEDIYNVMLTALETNENNKWKVKTPANQQYYESLDMTNIKGPLKDLAILFTSVEFFKLLHTYTELDLGGNHVVSPLCSIDIQRWRKGNYTIIGDNNKISNKCLDLILYFNAIDNFGSIVYLSQEDEVDDKNTNESGSDSENDSVLLTIYPKNNSLNLVYSDDKTTKFTKYISKNLNTDNDFVYILSCSYKE